MGVLRVFHSCYKGVSKVCQGCFKGNSRACTSFVVCVKVTVSIRLIYFFIFIPVYMQYLIEIRLKLIFEIYIETQS